MAKYRNVKYKGYHSIKEYNRAQRLKLMQKQGVIANLSEQVKYELIPAQYETYYVPGVRKMLTRRKCIEKAVNYYADFQYTKEGETIVEDCKGMKTKDYIIKRKLMLYIHGIKVLET